eukprot:scaffold82639_cov58-Phaeocystis_antarctica.AAC.3
MPPPKPPRDPATRAAAFGLRPDQGGVLIVEAVPSAGQVLGPPLKSALPITPNACHHVVTISSERRASYSALSKSRPVWPASATQAADWPRLAGARGSLRHALALKGAQESQLAEV